MEDKTIILPGDFEYDYTIANLPPPPDKNQKRHNFAGEYAYIARPGNFGITECVPLTEATEYVLGGEYDTRLEEFPNEEDYNPDDYCPYEYYLENNGLVPLGFYSDGWEFSG